MSIRKIVSFKSIVKILKPYSATLIGGSFDPFNSYYFRLLKWASELSRPLIVIVHPDEMVMLRRGFILPNDNYYKRAKIISRLDFIDWIIISKKIAHDPRCLNLLRPKVAILQRDNPVYIRKLFSVLSRRFPKITFKVAPFKRDFNLPIIKASLKFKWLPKDGKAKFTNIKRELISIAQRSNSPIGKISAILTKKDKIIVKEYNSRNGEHAEILLLKKVQLNRNFDDYVLYTLIPPCIMCAEIIYHSGIKKIYYLYNYGDRLGIKYLKDKKVLVKKYKKTCSG